MSYTICVTTKFINETLDLPRDVRKKITPLIRRLQRDPYLDAEKIKAQSHRETYRTHIGHDYRLIYEIREQQLIILTVRHRSKDYVRIPESHGGEIQIAEEAAAPQELPTPVAAPLITEAQLSQWQIPQDYWPVLLLLKHPDELLELEIPYLYLNRILDILIPTQTDRLSDKSIVALTDVEDIDRFGEGELEISAFLLPLSQHQEKLKTMQAQEAMLVKGAAGTGKSLLALYRAQYLSQQHPNLQILYVTYTESLAGYSHQLLKAILRQDPADYGITVRTIDQVALGCYPDDHSLPLLPDDGGLFLLEQAIKSEQPLYQQHRHWIERLGYRYLLEEITLVIEAHDLSHQKEYLEVQRIGRKERLIRRQREAIWQFYKAWMRTLEASGYTSIGKIRQDALAIAQQNRSKPYDMVIVDEAQDLSPTVLKLLAELVKTPGGLYLTADMSQSLYQRCFSKHYIQEVIHLPIKLHLLKQSYRATESIFKACMEIAQVHQIQDDEIVQTQPNSTLKGEKPTIVRMDHCLNQVKDIKDFLTKSANRWKIPKHHAAVLCPNRLMGRTIAQQLTTLHLNAEYVEGKEIDLQKTCVKVMSIYDAKGLEFPFVVVVGLEEGILPNLAGMPHQEQNEVLHEQAKLFYVACSRAMRSLRVYGSRLNPSRFVTALLKNSAWSEIKPNHT